MRREPGSDIIEFNDLDQRRFPGLPDWAPSEMIPGIYADILAAQKKNKDKIKAMSSDANRARSRSYAEYLAGLQQLHVVSIQLEAVEIDLAKCAPAEAIDAMLPAGA